jgi:preprotein translocase subunit SecF
MINFIKYYKLWFVVSGVVMLACVVSLAVFGLKLGIDFKGGTLAELTFHEGLPENAEISRTMRDNGFGEGVIQPTDSDTMIIRTAPMEKEEHDRMMAVFMENFGEITEEQYTSIGPVIGREMRNKAIYQLLLVTLGIIFYIAYAFRKVSKPVSSWKFGWAAIIALIHDLLIVVGVFAVLGYVRNVEIDTLFVTALLTVLGFSVHDTIVVFDRIRENLRTRSGQELSEIINSSVNQTLIRSINTTVTVLFVLLALIFFGGETIRYFVLALTIGVMVGTYSSIFIASPMLLVWHKLEMRRKGLN